MSHLQKYHGVIPALYACYEANGRFSPEKQAKLARHLVNKGVQGLYVGGSSGECIYLEKEERMAGLEAVMAEVGGKCTIIAHVACNNTAESMELAAHAEKCGVDAIASIPPIYFRLPEYAIAKYWNEISDAAPNTDFIIYNIPQLAGVALTPSLFREMRKNPRVIGVKNSSMPTQDIEGFKAMGGDDCVIFNGPDEQFLAGRAIGADGGIGGTYGAMPELFLQMNALIKDGKFTEAQPVQHEVNGIIADLCSTKGNMYAAIKAVLKINENLDCGSVRAPLYPLVPEDQAKVEKVASRIREAISTYVS